MLRLAIALLLFVVLVRADIYMQNPRGSNNRACETADDRQNANRLFNSQNNARGGYACPRAFQDPTLPPKETPKMYYYAGSMLRIEWTSQHSCGHGNTNCEIVIQYMCNDTAPGIRDGYPYVNTAQGINNPTGQNTIPTNDANNPTYGSHEPLSNYIKCNTRRRNAGLYISDQNLQNGGNRLPVTAPATRTRQSNDGQRYGFECDEEREYYPYWHPSPWRDIVVFTANTSRCDFYKQESMNVVPRGECINTKTGVPLPENTERECLPQGGTWVMTKAHGISPPECRSTDEIATRDNHLGNSVMGQMAHYDWTIPYDVIDENCVLRIRYNISSTDFKWETDSTFNGLKAYPRQDPLDMYGHGWYLSHALNTDQVGRTFQDRSYVFAIRRRPPGVSDNLKIYNLNVRGKRGNIVQTYPALEYDFVPTHLQVSGGDLIHFQWVGSDYNPNRDDNNGEGGPRTQNGLRSDRSNIVQVDGQGKLVPRHAESVTLFVNDRGQPDIPLIYKMALLDQPVNITDPSKKCLTNEQLLAVTNNNQDQADEHVQNCAKLNSASVYFDGGLVTMRATGTFHYMSTRNNNFSNRQQKASITVVGGWFASAPTSAPSFVLIAALVTLVINLL